MKYDLRKNGIFFFEQEDLNSDPVLSHVAKQLGVTKGGLEVEAESAEAALAKLFGENWQDLPEEICPSLRVAENGYWSDLYEITPETSW